MNAHVTDPTAMRDFVRAGRATFTLVSGKSGTRFTYRVEAPADDVDAPIRFVRVLTGPNNETDYKYVGTLRPSLEGHWEGLRFLHGGPKAKLGDHVPSVLGFGWFVAQLRRNDAEKLGQVEFWHEGRCGRCGRLLTDPESIARGLGPECASKVL